MNSLLPSVLQSPRMLAFELLMKQRLDAVKLDAVLVNLIDTVDSSALYWLAKQFSVLGVSGWAFADTEEKKRDLIKHAIELHRRKGTIWAIKEALRTIGFSNATITEHVQHWAGFTVQLNPGGQPVNATQTANAVALINEYKNVRSHLMGLEFIIAFEDSVFISEEGFEEQGDTYQDTAFLGGDFKYDGQNQYNGNKNYSADSDTIELNY